MRKSMLPAPTRLPISLAQITMISKHRARDSSQWIDDRPGDDTDTLPPHGHISHGSARFLHWIGQRRDREDGFDPEITELADLFEDWQADHTQTELSGWSE